MSNKKNEHIIEINERVLCKEDGMLLGNGDLSASVYQTADRIIWRLGKGDVWDRRIDFSDSPAPCTIEELIHGIKVEGWKCGPDGKGIEALRGTKNPERMKELCRYAPISYQELPAPKPVGEFVMQLPPDQITGAKVSQKLFLEQARLLINIDWDDGAKVTVESFITPYDNVLCVKWSSKGLFYGMSGRPIRFYLRRWTDPTVEEYSARFKQTHVQTRAPWNSPGKNTLPPLPAPQVRKIGETFAIEQDFPSENTFKDGFSFRMTPFAPESNIQPINMDAVKEACLLIVPKKSEPESGSNMFKTGTVTCHSQEGFIAVSVSTTNDPGGISRGFKTVKHIMNSQGKKAVNNWCSTTKKEAAKFWNKSGIEIGDKFLENIWYENLYISRCVHRKDTIPPGLLFPSTIDDYSETHSSYHMNYEAQEGFWGLYTNNHLELAEAFFTIADFLAYIGKKIAHDYYHCRGIFIQLSSYPIKLSDDIWGTVPLGRMIYMGGWVMEHFWLYYLYTLDKKFLKKRGYPFMKECALFYLDFLSKGDDQLYHAFPSCHGEDAFDGNPHRYTDRGQVMRHIRYCLCATIEASNILNVDPELRSQWQDRLDNLAIDNEPEICDPSATRPLGTNAYNMNQPEFSGLRYHQYPIKETLKKSWIGKNTYWHQWYLGHFIRPVLDMIRREKFVPERDYKPFCELLRRWRRPNGTLTAMSFEYGHVGCWTQTLGILAPIQEMMLQSWDGVIKIFPAWPLDIDVKFHNFRTVGAFIISAVLSKGSLQKLEVYSECGGICRFQLPWKTKKNSIVDSGGKQIDFKIFDKTFSFKTKKSEKYYVILECGVRYWKK